MDSVRLGKGIVVLHGLPRLSRSAEVGMYVTGPRVTLKCAFARAFSGPPPATHTGLKQKSLERCFIEETSVQLNRVSLKRVKSRDLPIKSRFLMAGCFMLLVTASREHSSMTRWTITTRSSVGRISIDFGFWDHDGATPLLNSSCS